MRDPLVLRGSGVAANAFRLTVLAWVLGEVYIQLRGRADRRLDDWTYFAVVGSFVAGSVLAVMAGQSDALAVSERAAWPVVVGLALIWAGLALRLWAFHTLGHMFKVRIEIQPGHRVVQDGPYRFLRHPSYTGSLVSLLGLGVALGSLLSVAAAVLIPAAGFVVRIEHEERQLREALGERYERYAERTRRLIPGVW